MGSLNTVVCDVNDVGLISLFDGVINVKTKRVVVASLRRINFKRPVFFHGLGRYISSRRRSDNIQIKEEKWKWVGSYVVFFATPAGRKNNYKRYKKLIF